MMVKPRLLPVPVFRAIECRARRSGIDIEYILSAPARRVGVVLVRAQAPFGGLHHRIDWYPAQVLQLSTGDVIGCRDPLDERFEIGWIALAARLDLERRNLAEVSTVLEPVNRRPH